MKLNRKKKSNNNNNDNNNFGNDKDKDKLKVTSLNPQVTPSTEYQHHLSLLKSCRVLSHRIHFNKNNKKFNHPTQAAAEEEEDGEGPIDENELNKWREEEEESLKTWQCWDPSPVCLHCREDPSAHCFYRVGLDRIGRHVIYSCAARARNRVVVDNMEHMAYEFERIFDHNSAPGKVVWVIDFKGFGLRDCNPAMGSTALPMFAAHYPERLGQIVLVDPPRIFAGLWAGVQPILDPVTKSKVVFLRGEANFKTYADIQWRGLEPDFDDPNNNNNINHHGRKGGGNIDPDLATFLKRIEILKGVPGYGDENHRIDDNQLCFLRDPIATERIRRTIAVK
eukprot:CAMPEP_0114336896 /NCGR_PEP_ID=MMETSP0101-20121206/6013_1 /TAXON_ID=38822 ORGANISM="Pteridomonas danica, Strain PT" /NCGR_SAMPLE_ID=MMETSP0101 /ASSEMBLY_ACC=CAM_ASM_000211 /LENGTH=336 /DNA_ID=CAMNT_0001468973 /DNA_START=30 /DNA_END=1040 /DNA_ORIENTATION=+